MMGRFDFRVYVPLLVAMFIAGSASAQSRYPLRIAPTAPMELTTPGSSAVYDIEVDIPMDLSVGGLPLHAAAAVDPSAAATRSVLTVTTDEAITPNRYLFYVYGRVGTTNYRAEAILEVSSTAAVTRCPGFLDWNSYFADAPSGAAVADFNRDGINDVAVANQSANTISLLLANGTGTLREALTYAVATNPLDLATADINNDGKADLVVANHGSNSISVLLGKGDGTFQPAVQYSAGAGPVSLAVADFNHDGKTDVAVANDSSSDISILLGNGDGTLKPAVNYALPTGSQAIATGDLNGDGAPDLAVTAIFPNSTLSILIGTGDGTFRDAVTMPADSPFAIAVGDVTGDAKPDIVYSKSLTTDLIVLPGLGDGTFAASTSLETGVYGYLSSIAIADVDNDGRMDLVETSAAQEGGTVVLRGDGAGHFSSSRVTTAEGGRVKLV